MKYVLRVVMHAIPVVGLIGGIYWLSTDQLPWWDFGLLFIGALAWGYARGKA